MSASFVTEVGASRKVRRCEGCNGFATINVGDRYYSIFYADGSDCSRYAMCAPCYEHAQSCDECMRAWIENESPHGVSECREMTEYEAKKSGSQPAGGLQ